MILSEAVRKAMDADGCITNGDMVRKIKIRPTDGAGCCIVMGWDGESPSKHGWNPRAKDSIRDDWELAE